MAPVRVFGPAKSINVARMLLCLEEVGAEYELVHMDLFQAKEQNSPEHLARNPFGKVPALQDGDLVLFEARAIAKYVLRKYKTEQADLLREGDPEEAVMVDVWTEVEAHQYHQALRLIMLECFLNPTLRGLPTNQEVVYEAVEKTKKVLEIYEARLSEHRYLAGDFFSFADLNHFASTFYIVDATPYGSLLDSYPRVKAWWEDLMSRPGLVAPGFESSSLV
ncbi:probable glutathione S-transferase GSTF1 [Triticum dicoccoides]|nr:probable glutathione S-transferase GSTF1 [Triticum dicoccoides]XP_044393281.1 probable glutathione S-transferase GSTF1 [Triticum aestivum]